MGQGVTITNDSIGVSQLLGGTCPTALQSLRLCLLILIISYSFCRTEKRERGIYWVFWWCYIRHRGSYKIKHGLTEVIMSTVHQRFSNFFGKGILLIWFFTGGTSTWNKYIDTRNRNRNLKISKAPLKSQAHQGTSLLTSAATNQRGVFQRGSREAQVRFPEYQEGTE